MATDALAPCVTRASAAMILTVQCGSEFYQTTCPGWIKLCFGRIQMFTIILQLGVACSNILKMGIRRTGVMKSLVRTLRVFLPYVFSEKSLINIGSGNGLLPNSTKPLPEPILTRSCGRIRVWKHLPGINKLIPLWTKTMLLSCPHNRQHLICFFLFWEHYVMMRLFYYLFL